MGCDFHWKNMSGAIVSSINSNIALLTTDKCMHNAQMHASAYYAFWEILSSHTSCWVSFSMGTDVWCIFITN